MMTRTKEYRKQLAESFLHVLEEKQLDWKKEWMGPTGYREPVNGRTGYRYRGINRFYLTLISMDREYQDNRWCTFNQIKDKGWKLVNAKGQGVKVEYWFPYDTEEKKSISWEELRLRNEKIGNRYTLRASYKTVFNGSLIEGIPELPIQEPKEIAPDKMIQRLSVNMGVPIINDGGDQAFYRPSEDTIHLPLPEYFETEYAYDSTALHELAHSTGAPHRLNRDLSGWFGSQVYAYEELVAEISSCFMSINLQVEQSEYHIQNHKAYVQSWIQTIKEKPETLIRAIQQAEKTASYMEYKAELIEQKDYEQIANASMDVSNTTLEKAEVKGAERMVSLRNVVKDHQKELQDGIEWVVFWREGSSWNAESFRLKMDDTLYPEDKQRLREIKTLDSAAVIVNGYYSAQLTEDMSLDELTEGVRFYYENDMSKIEGFLEAHDDRLSLEMIEEGRKAAHAVGLPFSETPYSDEDTDPYIYDGSMSIEDFELMHRLKREGESKIKMIGHNEVGQAVSASVNEENQDTLAIEDGWHIAEEGTDHVLYYEEEEVVRGDLGEIRAAEERIRNARENGRAVGEAFQKVRTEHGYTREQMAEIALISDKELQLIEEGKIYPDRLTLQIVGNVCMVHTENLKNGQIIPRKSKEELDMVIQEIKTNLESIKADTTVLVEFAQKYGIQIQVEQNEKEIDEYYVVEDQKTGETLIDTEGKEIRMEKQEDAERFAEKMNDEDKILQMAEELVREYEQSIGRTDSVLDQYSEEQVITYAAMCQKYLMFGQAVEDCLNYKIDQREAIKVCDTPSLFVEAGCRDLPMHITQSHLRACMHEKDPENAHYHGLTLEEVKKLPEALETPAIMAESSTRRDSIVAVLGYREGSGNPVVVSIVPNGQATYKLEKVDSNFITSMYGKEKSEQFIMRLADQGKLIFVDKEKSEELALLPLQLRQDHPVPAFNSIIKRIGGNVNEDVRKDAGEIAQKAMKKLTEATKQIQNEAIKGFSNPKL